MNNDFQTARKTEAKITKLLLISFFLSAICAIFKNIGNYKLAMTSIANGVFFSVFYIYINQTRFFNSVVFPNLIKLNIAFCIYDLMMCFCICLFDTFGFAHNIMLVSRMKLFIISCFVSMVFDCILIYFLFQFNIIKKRIVQLEDRLRDVESDQNDQNVQN